MLSEFIGNTEEISLNRLFLSGFFAIPYTILVYPLIYLLILVAVGVLVWYYGQKRARARRLAGRPLYS